MPVVGLLGAAGFLNSGGSENGPILYLLMIIGDFFFYSSGLSPFFLFEVNLEVAESEGLFIEDRLALPGSSDTSPNNCFSSSLFCSALESTAFFSFAVYSSKSNFKNQ